MNIISHNIISERYRILRKIGEGTISTVFLAQDIEDNNAECALKLLKDDTVSHRIENIIRFNTEASIASRLNYPGVVKIHNYGLYNDQHYIVMDYIEGESLRDIQRKGISIKIEDSISVIFQLCRALQNIHDNGIIHRDLKPSNIMIPMKDHVFDYNNPRLIDFGLSHIREFKNMDDEDVIIGTFSYMPPEQSGVIKRIVDERSDLYSLGIIFYELLSGVLPYMGENLTMLLHKHIASRPVPLRNIIPEIPEIFEKIIQKMMEKEPDRRYQSAMGIYKDLDLFRKGFKDFPIAEYDMVTKPVFRSALVGRKEEMETLKKLYNEALKGNGGICMISGSAGSGKSRLGEEIRNTLYSTGGMFISRKCFQSMSRIPYGPFREVLNVYINIFRKKPEWERREISGKIRKEIADLGEIVNQFNPQMKEIIGAQSSLVELEPDRETQRFLMVIKKLFLIIAEIEKVLIIQIDDLQWSDEGSLSLLIEMAHGTDVSHCLIIGTYRIDEIEQSHGLLRFINNARDRGYPIHGIELNLFNENEMKTFIAELLSQDSADINQISEYIFRKTKGNPYFAIEILKQLIEEKAIVFKDNSWIFQHGAENAIPIASTIIDIIIKRISILKDQEKIVLMYAAVIGKKINIDLLITLGLNIDIDMGRKYSNYSDDPPRENYIGQNEIVAIIDKAISLQFLEEDPQEPGVLAFAHDRIRETFYSTILDQQRRKLHLLIALNIESNCKDENSNAVFDLAYHYMEAGDPQKIIQYAYSAGMIAKANYANEEALGYFNTALKYLEETFSQGKEMQDRLKWVACKEEIGKIYLTVGEIEKAIELYNVINIYKETKLEKAKICRQICVAYFKKGDWGNCEKYGKMGLKFLGENLPVNKLLVVFGILRELLKRIIHSNVPIFFRKGTKEPEKEKSRILLYVSLNWMYILSDTRKFVNIMLRMMNVSELKLGESKELGMSLAVYASSYVEFAMFKRGDILLNQALEMRKRLGDEWGVGQSLQFMAYCSSWQAKYQISNEYFRKSLDIFRKIGDLWEIGMVTGGISYNEYLTANYNSSLTLIREYQIISMNLMDYYGLSRCYQFIALSFIEKGELKSAEEYLTEALEISTNYNLNFNRCFNYTAMGSLYIEMGEYDKAISYLAAAATMERENFFIKDFTVLIHPKMAEAHLRKFLIDNQYVLKRNANDIKNLRKLCRRALEKTRKRGSHYGIALRVNGLFYSMMKDRTKAEHYFKLSVEHNSETGRRFETAKSLMEYGLFLSRTGSADSSKKKFESAYRIFLEIGAEGYVKKLAFLLGISKEDDENQSDNVMDRSMLSTIIRLSHDIISILNVDDLLDHIMTKAMEVTGAQRGYLFIKSNENDFHLKVQKNIDDSGKAEYSKHIIEEVFRTGETIITTNAERDKRFSVHQSVVRYGLKSILCIPIKHHEKIIGLCYLDNPLTSSVFTESDNTILGVFMAQAGIAIENAYFYQDLESKVKERTRELKLANEELGNAYSSVSQAYNIIKEDLALARKVQESILPRNAETVSGLHFNIRYLPMSDVGGDVYDIAEVKKGYVRIFIADATGHGVQAALITMIIMSEYDKLKNIITAPSVLLDSLNKIMIEQYKALKIIFTCAIVDIDIMNEKLIFSCAGHPVQYLVKKDQVVHMERTGRIIGLDRESRYKSETFQFNGGDKLLLVTDGIYEQFDSSNKTYGEERLQRIINENKEFSIKHIIDSIYNDIGDFFNYSKKFNENDDVTVIGVAAAD